MKTENELIAEFMGIDYRNKELKYDRDWNWMKEVFAEIEARSPSLKMSDFLKALKNASHPINIFMQVTSLHITAPMSEVYPKVIEFIKWYNSQNPKS